jgi:predicted dithiol-disulfide oxidoreductase (DUF899 family)
MELSVFESARKRGKQSKGDEMTTLTYQANSVVSNAEWTESRRELLAKEKELTRLRDEVSRTRRSLPWTKVEKTYEFLGGRGPETLASLFDGRSQLIVYHFMLGPGWAEGCKSCSFLADHFDGTLLHLAHRDVTFAVISRAPLNEIQAFQKRMGWSFKWVSSYGSAFNFDFGVSFTKEALAQGEVPYNYSMQRFGADEAPGVSVFYKDKGEVFHTYSSFGRGLDIFVGTYNLLDLTPKGRDEDGLAFSMSWVRHHDRYDDNYRVDTREGYVPPKIGAQCCKSAENGG